MTFGRLATPDRAHGGPAAPWSPQRGRYHRALCIGTRSRCHGMRYSARPRRSLVSVVSVVCEWTRDALAGFTKQPHRWCGPADPQSRVHRSASRSSS